MSHIMIFLTQRNNERRLLQAEHQVDLYLRSTKKALVLISLSQYQIDMTHYSSQIGPLVLLRDGVNQIVTAAARSHCIVKLERMAVSHVMLVYCTAHECSVLHVNGVDRTTIFQIT